MSGLFFFVGGVFVMAEGGLSFGAGCFVEFWVVFVGG